MTDRSEPLLGRESEKAGLGGFLRRAASDGEALVITGGPGVGKTSLLRWAVEASAELGTVVLSGSGTEAEVEVRFSALHELLYPYRSWLPLLDPRHHEALAAVLGLSDGPPAPRATVSAATVALVDHVAREQPVMVAVDDVQWVDRPSAEVLALLARGLPGHRIGFLATMREGSRPFFDHGSLPHLSVRPLEAPDAESLLARRDPLLPRTTRDGILRWAEGNPLALLELPLDPDSGTPSHAVPALSARLQALFAPRIEQLPASARSFLLLAALDVSSDLNLVLAAAAPRVSEADAQVCQQRGLVSLDLAAGTVRFTHPLVRSTTVALASWLDRREGHRALGSANVGHVQRQALHLAAAAVGPDEAVASLLEDAAQLLLRRGDAEGSVAALLRSAELSAQPQHRARRLSHAAYVEADMTGDLDRVSSLLAQARRELPPGEQSLETAVAAAYLLLNGDGDVDTAHRLLVGALRASRPLAASDAIRTEALFTLMWICFFAGRAEMWEPFQAEVEHLGAAAPPLLRLCAATFATPAATGARARPEVLAAVAALDTETHPSHVSLVGRAAFYVDELAGCRSALWRVVDGGHESEAVTSVISAWMLLGFEAFLAGQWDETIRYCEQGLELTTAHGYELLAWPGRYGVAVVAAARGDEVAASLCDEMLQWAQPRAVRSVMAYAHHVMAVTALGRRDYESAFRHASGIVTPGLIEPGLAHALWLALDLVDAAAHSNRPAEARMHVRAMRATHFDDLSTRCALILAGCEAMVASPEDSEALYERAVSMPEADRWPFELARLQLGFGEHLRRARRISQARDVLQAALEGFALLGAEPWKARTRSELDACSSRHTSEPTAPLLTRRELEVATLAASGLTNTQIGARLDVSPRTVSAHLSRTLAKLQLTSRAGINDALRAAVDGRHPSA